MEYNKILHTPPRYAMETPFDCGATLIANLGYVELKDNTTPITLQSVKENWYDGFPDQKSPFANLCDSPVHHELTIQKFGMSIKDVTDKFDQWVPEKTGVLIMINRKATMLHWVRFMGFSKNETGEDMITLDMSNGKYITMHFEIFLEQMYENYSMLKCAYVLELIDDDKPKLKWHFYFWFSFVQLMKKIYYKFK